MTGENTENPQDSREDATADAPASGGEPVAPLAAAAPPAASAPPTASGVEPFAVPAPETVEVPDAEAAIENFEVPPPPTFGAVRPAPSPEPVIPPAPSDAAGNALATPALRKRSTWAPDDTWTSASAHKQEVVPPTAAQKAESRAAASRAATAREAASRDFVSPAAGGTAEGSYRGWTVAIFLGLAVLLIGAIVLIAFLVGNTSLALPSPDAMTIAQSAASYLALPV